MILLILASLAAGPQPREPSCVEIKAYVEIFGERAAIARAKRHGFTQADIDRIRRKCLIPAG